MVFGPEVDLFRVVLQFPESSTSLLDRIRLRCGGRDWSGARDLLVGTVVDDFFDVRRPLARRTPVRCIVHGEVAPVGEGAAVTLRFRVPFLLPVLFWVSPIFLPSSVPCRGAIFALLVATTAAFLVREVRLTRALIENVLSNPGAGSA